MKSALVIATATIVLTACSGEALVEDVIHGTSPEVETAARAIERDPGPRHVPLPPVVPNQAGRLAQAVRAAMQPLEQYVDPDLVRKVACLDFSFYTDTGHLVPDSPQLARIFAYQLGDAILRSPYATLSRAADDFRRAVMNARSASQARDAAITLYCDLSA